MNLFSRMLITVRPNSVVCPGSVAHEARIKTEVASHPGGRLDTVIRCCSDEHYGSDTGRMEASFQIGAYEGTVDPLGDDRLTLPLASLVLD